VSTARFDGRARLVSGSSPPSASVVTYRVTLAGGSLRLGPAGTDGTVLDVAVTRVLQTVAGRMIFAQPRLD